MRLLSPGLPTGAGLICHNATVIRDKIKGTINKNHFHSTSNIYSVLEYVKFYSIAFYINSFSCSRNPKFRIIKTGICLQMQMALHFYAMLLTASNMLHIIILTYVVLYFII
jgi:hypothetical protein